MSQHQQDYMNEEGAATIAYRLREYWRAKGHDVKVSIIPFSIEQNREKGRMFSVRSDMLNGVPRSVAP